MTNKEKLLGRLEDLKRERSKLFKKKAASPLDIAKATQKIEREIAQVEAELAEVTL